MTEVLVAVRDTECCIWQLQLLCCSDVINPREPNPKPNVCHGWLWRTKGKHVDLEKF